MTIKKTNLIILDFNGTLFPHRFVFAENKSDPVLVNVINTLCDRYGFKIVISSTMREQGVDACRDVLRKSGINPSFLWDKTWTTMTAGLLTSERYRQVEMFVEKYREDIEQLVVFDDERCPMVSPIEEFWYHADEDAGVPKYLLFELLGRFPEILKDE